MGKKVQTMSRSVAVTLVVLTILACSRVEEASGLEAQSDEIHYEVVAEGPYSGLTKERHAVVQDRESWARLWQEIHRPASPKPELPAIDFSTQLLIAVATGTRSSGGYIIEVEEIEATGDTLHITVLETCPPRGAMTVSSLTQPFQVVWLERLDLAPRFRLRKSPSCR